MESIDNLDKLDVFGKFLIANIRDSIISESEALISGKALRPNSYEFAQKLAKLDKEDIDNVRELIAKSIDYSLSNFLHDLQSRKGHESDVRIMVGDTDISKIDAFLQGELHSDEGWIERFSDYKPS
jgi:hypothetical protein